jgi:hypothetical protein
MEVVRKLQVVGEVNRMGTGDIASRLSARSAVIPEAAVAATTLHKLTRKT